METLVHTICCPNCAEAVLSFSAACESECDACGFRAQLFADRRAAQATHSAFRADRDVIVADLAPLGKTRWVVAHTRLFLV